MNINLLQFQSVTEGAVRVTQNEQGFHFYRFTEEQEALSQKETEKKELAAPEEKQKGKFSLFYVLVPLCCLVFLFLGFLLFDVE